MISCRVSNFDWGLGNVLEVLYVFIMLFLKERGEVCNVVIIIF